MRNTFIGLTGVLVLGLAGAAQADSPKDRNGKAQARGGVHAGAHMPNAHASDRAKEVHRMLAAGENPGRAYGHDRREGRTSAKASMRTNADVRADRRRGVRADANTRVRGSADVLAANDHASPRGVERGSRSTVKATASHGRYERRGPRRR